ncbi:hypothetical protein VITU102760_19710 [Vibrio tubiashii]|uniref:Membrane protein n=1 Tax=Vibrio tubiashii ATCC 19109 TaxID=1051646 RepID=F9TBS8_9VIBR|nr:hypothetical protein [Vibrio tubiashii]AIW17267.1 membrane protein [Vibrio tubiashii ATCC 19109]EGU48630.1 putative membrane protein [Vibrio tubiashii ATCC 19109]EIF04968.1 putative membrane protein [Vibrio tubiashii NCIMB 1337 = ATCC 19106]
MWDWAGKSRGGSHCRAKTHFAKMCVDAQSELTEPPACVRLQSASYSGVRTDQIGKGHGANIGCKPSLRQYIIRYLGYIVATLPLGLGIVWMAFSSNVDTRLLTLSGERRVSHRSFADSLDEEVDLSIKSRHMLPD